MKTLLLFFLTITSLLTARDIHLWHAFDGFLEQTFLKIVDDFNSSSETAHIIPVRKGDYKDAYAQGVEATKKGNGPHILQVYEVATLSMMLQPELYVPIEELMKKYHHHFDPDIYIDTVRKFYCDPNGNMLSLPWNASTGILYYNKDAFRKAGLDPERPPRTWAEFEFIAGKLLKAGYNGFTTAWPVAYHLEHVSSWHDLPFGTEENGFKGLNARLVFNGPEQIFHIQKVSEWSKKGYFLYSGRDGTDSQKFFSDQKCAILLHGANRRALFEPDCDFEIGVGYLPYWPHLIEKPQNLNIGGTSFWAMSGFSKDEYKAIAQFFAFLSCVGSQVQWHQATGYLPITDAAYYLTKKKGFYEENPTSKIAVLSVIENRPTEHSYGVRFGNYIEVRDLINDYLEKAFTGELSAEEALARAVKEGNVLLDAYEKAHKD